MMTLMQPAKPPVVLAADTAADLMTPDPAVIRADATVLEAVRFLGDRGISAAPVVDAAGRPVGVVSQTDILIHARENAEEAPAPETPLRVARPAAHGLPRVRDIMTPAMFSCPEDAPVAEVVEYMPALAIHHLFVVNRAGALVGVISALDVLRKLKVGAPSGRPT